MSARTNEYLRDIIESAEIMGPMVEGLTYETFLGHDLAKDAVHYSILVIGEACRRIRDVNEALIDEHSVLAKWTGMRNILAHDYGNVMEDIVWQAATKDRLKLIQLAKHLLNSDL